MQVCLQRLMEFHLHHILLLVLVSMQTWEWLAVVGAKIHAECQQLCDVSSVIFVHIEGHERGCRRQFLEH